MAVFTSLSTEEINNIFLQYFLSNSDSIKNISPINEGLQNSNYLIETAQSNKMVLTLFEDTNDYDNISFITNLLLFLNQNNYPTSTIYQQKDNNLIFQIRDKYGMINKFLDGKNNCIISQEKILSITKNIVQLHKLTSNYETKRDNPMGIMKMTNLFTESSTLLQSLSQAKKISSTEYQKLSNILAKANKSLDFIKQHQRELKKLPHSIVHADLFIDNIFFSDNNLTGIIDWCFACYSYSIVDIANIINSLCFANNVYPDIDTAINDVLSCYQSEMFNNIKSSGDPNRNIDYKLEDIYIVCLQDALRFLATRLFNYISIELGSDNSSNFITEQKFLVKDYTEYEDKMLVFMKKLNL